MRNEPMDDVISLLSSARKRMLMHQSAENPAADSSRYDEISEYLRRIDSLIFDVGGMDDGTTMFSYSMGSHGKSVCEFCGRIDEWEGNFHPGYCPKCGRENANGQE